MARYRQQELKVREFEDVTIVLPQDRERIWAYPKKGAGVILFHRFYAPLGSFQPWHRFRKKLDENKNISLAACFRWADQHEIQHMVTTRAPSLEEIKKHATKPKEEK